MCCDSLQDKTTALAVMLMASYVDATDLLNKACFHPQAFLLVDDTQGHGSFFLTAPDGIDR